MTAREWRRRTAGRRRLGWTVVVGTGSLVVALGGALAWGWWSGLGRDAGVAIDQATTAPDSPSPAERPRTTYQALTYELRTTGSPRTARDATIRLRGSGDDDGTYCEITQDAGGRITRAWIVLAGTSRGIPVTVSVRDEDGDAAGGEASALLTAGAGPKRREYTWDPARGLGAGSFVWSPEGTMALEATLVTAAGSELGVLASFSCDPGTPPA